ncbi:MAG: hypothetical protein GW789_17395 [Ignavibacteria bacterium]|nr:hypothetical protein [Ignavibacteria bacterium]
MQKLLFLALVYILNCSSFAHKEWVHQHIVYEAYNLLKYGYSIEIPIIEENMGSFGPGDGKWIHGEILKGAYREDLEDVVTGVGAINQGWNPSSTHFGDVDNNDFGNTPITYVWTSPVINAFNKAYKFINGGWRVTVNNNVYIYQ